MPTSQRLDFLPADRKVLPKSLSGTTGITSLTFVTAAKKRDHNIESDFVIQEENFAANNNAGSYTQMFNLGSGTIQNVDGKFQFIGAGGGTTAVAYRMHAPIVCPWFVISADIEAGLATQTTNSSVGVGIVDTGTANADKYWVEYNEIGNVIKIRKIINNSVTDVLTATTDGRPSRIYAVWTGKYVSAWTAGSNGNPNAKCWGVADSSSDMDMRVHGSYSTRVPYLVMQPDSGGIVRINRWCHALYGGLGCANHTLIRYKDGTPILIGNKYYFTATIPGMSTNPEANPWVHFHSGIFSIDRDTFEIRETAKLFQKTGTRTYGQHVYAPVYDPTTNTWTLTHSTFGSSDVISGQTLKYNTFKGDLLHGVHILPAATSVGITKTGGGAETRNIYDSNFVWINGTIYFVYVVVDGADYNICFASGSSLDALTQYAQETSFYAEGPKIAKVADTWIVTSKAWTSGGGVTLNNYVAWNLTTGTRIGTFAADLAESGITKTHTPIWADSRPDGTTRYFMLCHLEDTSLTLADSSAQISWTQGGTLVQIASSTNAGHEHPQYVYPYPEPTVGGGSQRKIPAVVPLPDSRRYSTTASGTAYSLTASSAAIDFGTTDPSITLAEAGKYQIEADVLLKYNGATFASSRTVTLKLRRTNNTAADLTNCTVTLPTEVTTTLTGTMCMVHLRADDYTNAGASDAITIFGDVSVAPSAGSLDVTFAKIYARKIA